jgi:farnesyl-diphosphate farnesyltransferase
VRALQSGGGHRGFVEFTALPVILARATLDVVEAEGPGTKISRARVMAEAAALDARLDAGESALTG